MNIRLDLTKLKGFGFHGEGVMAMIPLDAIDGGLNAIRSLPAPKAEDFKEGKFIVCHSETGNSHVLDVRDDIKAHVVGGLQEVVLFDPEYWDRDVELTCTIGQGQTTENPRHSSVSIPKPDDGYTWVKFTSVEFDPLTESLRRVAD